MQKNKVIMFILLLGINWLAAGSELRIKRGNDIQKEQIRALKEFEESYQNTKTRAEQEELASNYFADQKNRNNALAYVRLKNVQCNRYNVDCKVARNGELSIIMNFTSDSQNHIEEKRVRK